MRYQYSRFSTNGCVIHKLEVDGYAGHFSAWFDNTKTLIAAEHWVARGTRTRNVKPDSGMWARLQDKGKAIIVREENK